MPSETRLSPLARLPLTTDFYNRYFFNESIAPDFWQFRGGQGIHELETAIARDSLRRLAAARHVNTRPISGMSAMLVAIAGLGGRSGRTVVTIAEQAGGHYATGGIVSQLGYHSVTVDVRAGRVDEAQLVAAVHGNDVSLVYLDLQNSLDMIDVGGVAKVLREHSPTTVLHVDCSHTLGLVLGGAHDNPLRHGADSMGGSTHKSFPGPHKGVLFTDSDELDQRIRDAQMRLISSHHFAETMALGLAAAEFEQFGSVYASSVVRNAAALGAALSREGFGVVGTADAFTHTHQVWVKAGDDAETQQLAERLYAVGIRVNIQTTMPRLPGALLRLGVNEVTFEGATVESMSLLAQAFSAARYRSSPSRPDAAEIRRSFAAPHFYDADTVGAAFASAVAVAPA